MRLHANQRGTHFPKNKRARFFFFGLVFFQTTRINPITIFFFFFPDLSVPMANKRAGRRRDETHCLESRALTLSRSPLPSQVWACGAWESFDVCVWRQKTGACASRTKCPADYFSEYYVASTVLYCRTYWERGRVKTLETALRGTTTDDRETQETEKEIKRENVRHRRFRVRQAGGASGDWKRPLGSRRG